MAEAPPPAVEVLAAADVRGAGVAFPIDVALAEPPAEVDGALEPELGAALELDVGEADVLVADAETEAASWLLPLPQALNVAAAQSSVALFPQEIFMPSV